MAIDAPFSVVFPAFEHGLREPDPSFQKEVMALEAAGIPFHVVNTEVLMDGDVHRALRHIGRPRPDCIIYRGWILHPSEYRELHRELSMRGFKLFTSPEAYEYGLLLPKYYPLIEPHAIPAIWIQGADAADAISQSQKVGKPPYYIKDYAKSAKAIFPRGCIVEESTEQNMAEAIAELREYRADRFEGGVVIRPLVKLRYLDEGPFGGEVYEEYRLYFLCGKLIAQNAYDHIGGDPESLPDFGFLGKLIPSPFFTADVVVTDEGQHRILEIGDGGTSALPPTLTAEHFYQQVIESLTGM